MPRRWSDLDTDTHRLPPGFTRTGYDSNTRRYRFSDAEGRMYQGEPGEEFGGRLTPITAIDPSVRHRFAPDDDEVEEEENVVDSPSSPSEAGSPQPTPRTAPSFSDFLSSSQMTTATPPMPPQKKQSDRSSTFSLKRTATSFMRFRSTKSKGKVATLPSLPYSGTDEWGTIQSPHSSKF